MNLLLGIPTRPFASMRRAKGPARGTACAVFRNELQKYFRPCSPESFGGAWATITVKLMFLPSISRTRKRGEEGFRSDSCSHQHRSVSPSLDSELSFSICATCVCHKILLLACDIDFDARFLHSYHVASVQAHVSVNLVDGAVCVDSILVTA